MPMVVRSATARISVGHVAQRERADQWSPRLHGEPGQGLFGERSEAAGTSEQAWADRRDDIVTPLAKRSSAPSWTVSPEL